MTKQLKPKKCKICKELFTPITPLQMVDGPDCAYKYVVKQREKKEKEEGKDMRRVNKLLEEKIRSHSGWLQILQKLFNRWIVLRDKSLPCISCGTTNDVMYSCGHYYTVGSYPNLRFDTDNCHKQCLNYCNKNLSGNIVEYTPNLIRKIGQEQFNALEDRRHTLLKITIPEIIDEIARYKLLIKEKKKKNETTI